MNKIKVKYLGIYIVIAFITNRILIELENSYDWSIYKLGYFIDISIVIALIWLIIKVFIDIFNKK
ncbi:MAG: hypothetical protein WD607_11245 [Candidatus Paceibacterota bacterium]